MEEDRITTPTGDQALLEEIRRNYRYAHDYWAPIREQRSIDMRYLCGDPWEPKDRKIRELANRPCINHDELNQYVNQGVNQLRMNKRGIKVEPRGAGASDKTATLRQDIIRTIEYKSKAQSAYLRAGQDMYEGSYGFFRISRKYVLSDPDPKDPRAFDQEIVIKVIPNPDSVLYDPDCKEPDWSDAHFAFILEPMSIEDEFKIRFPHAQKTDFTAEDLKVAKDWIQDKTIVVAEYWKVTTTRFTITQGSRKRIVERKRVCQYMTNGIEILEENEEPGEEIPIPSMVGMERFVDEGSGPKRMLFSLPRLARNPQMSLAYLCSQETEEAGMSPKVPIMGYVGQFETDSEAWTNLNKIPVSFIQVDALTDATGQQTLPLPQWRQFVPNFQAYEMAKDGARRAIQAAMGVSPLPTAAQRDNEKSGVALEKIKTAEAVGSYHFVEGYERGLSRAGRIIDSWIPVVYDAQDREEHLQQANDTRRKVILNTEAPYQNEKTGEQEHYQIGEEQHDTSVSTGPSYDSQRDALASFLDTLIANLKDLPIAPPQAAKLLSLAIKMKELGPRGDEMAEIISPNQGDQSGQLSQMQQQLQQQGQLAQQMQAELQKLVIEKQGKVIDNEYRMKIEQMKIESDLAKAEITTKAQQLEERMKFVEDLWQQLHTQAHDAGMQAQEHDQQNAMAQQQQAAASQQQQAQQQHEQQQAQFQAQQQPEEPAA